MSTSKVVAKKQSAPAQAVVVEASAHGLNGFDDKVIADRIIAAHTASMIEGQAKDTKADAAFQTCLVAVTLRTNEANASIADEAFQSAWRYSMRGILPRLLAAGVSWVEQTQTVLKDGEVKAGYRMTSYGQNISSNAQQAAIWLTVEEVTEAASLTEVRKRIKAKRDAEAESELTAEQVECLELAAKLLEGFNILQELLADAESAAAYQAAMATMLELITANTPIDEQAVVELVAVAK